MKILSLFQTAKKAEQSLMKGQEYIDAYWDKLLRHNTSDDGTLIGLKHSYIIASNDDHENYALAEQYYWDTYFIALGLINPKYEELVCGMLENLLDMFKRFGLVPNASRMYFTGRSQPPVLSSLIFLIYDRYGKSTQWLNNRMEIAEREYHTVWMSHQHPTWHQAHKGLSRYYDINVLHDLAEAESGWDMTPRFERKCLDYLPVDLNSLLYKYEIDFARWAEIAGKHEQMQPWHKKAEYRKQIMNRLMWGKLRGFFFDYNYAKEETGTVWSLAGYFPMWVGMASKQQAARMVANLTKFERKGGLTTTTKPIIDMSMFGSLKTQWAYPNGWAPLHVAVIEGLRRYGYDKEADRIAHKWLTTNLVWFEKHGAFIEKYNVVNPKKSPLEGVYPSQSGFGWTNSVYTYLLHQLEAQQDHDK